MQRVGAVGTDFVPDSHDDEFGGANWEAVPGAQQTQKVKVKSAKKKMEVPPSLDVEEQFAVKALETVEEYRKGKKSRDPSPPPLLRPCF